MPVLRAVVFEAEPLGLFHAEARGSGLDSWLGGGPRVELDLEVSRVARVGLLVQEPPCRSVSVAWGPVIAVEGLGEQLCRFHEGPRGEFLGHRYCVNMAVTRDGYCVLHRSSWKALYERCAQGYEPACLEAHRLNPDEEFAVYVLDYGGSRVKVGLTQSWRLLWRIAEQPHVAAARVYEGGLLDARETEKRLGRMRLATEGAAARLEERFRLAAGTLTKLQGENGWARAAERLARMLASLGLEGRFRAYAVTPREPGWLFSARRVADPVELLGRRLRVVDYWAGVLALRGEDDRVVAVHRRLLQHRLLYGVIREYL